VLRSETVVRSVVAALAAAAALLLIVPHIPNVTPVDRVLPVVAVLVVAVCAGLRTQDSGLRTAAQLAVPLLAIAAIAIPDERMRLAAYGVIVAGAFAAALATAPRTFVEQSILAIAAIVILRWLPTPELWREAVVLAGALALLAAIREQSPLATIAVVAVALVTPSHPGKLLLFPFVVAIVVLLARTLPASAAVALTFFAAAFFARASVAPLWFTAGFAAAVPLFRRARLDFVFYAIALVLFAMWPWSGLVARTLPRLLAAEHPHDARVIGRSLPPGTSLELGLGARHGIVLTMSGANVARLRAGKHVADVEVLDSRGRTSTRTVRIGDIADFGFLRRDQFFAARKPLPRVPLADIRGYGLASFLYGAGSIAIDGDVAAVRITAAPELPRGAAIEVESVELR